MRKTVLFQLVLVLCLLSAFTLAGQALAQGKMQSFSGKVTNVDPAGKAIVIESGTGKGAMTVGAAVTGDTVLMVKGKKLPIADLVKEVKAGDMVGLKVERTSDLFAKEITKK